VDPQSDRRGKKKGKGARRKVSGQKTVRIKAATQREKMGGFRGNRWATTGGGTRVKRTCNKKGIPGREGKHGGKRQKEEMRTSDHRNSWNKTILGVFCPKRGQTKMDGKK